MKNLLLGIIAINLTFITGHMVLQSVPTATAQEDIKVCNIYIKKNSIENIENCKAGDILMMSRANVRNGHYWHETMARACEVNSMWTLPPENKANCVYRGKLLDLIPLK